MMDSKYAFKYQTPFKGTYKMLQTWKTGSGFLQMVEVTTRVNICRSNTYKNSKDVNIFNQDER